MANFVQGQAPFINGGKDVGSDPGQQYPPYQSWPQQQYPGYHPNPWYPPYHQFPQHPEAPVIKQEVAQPPHIKQEYPPQADAYQLGPPQYPPQGPPHYPPQGPPQYPHQQGPLQYPPYFNPYAAPGFPPQQESWNGYNYNPSMPAWNNGPSHPYYQGWQQFPQAQNQHQNVLQDNKPIGMEVDETESDVKQDNFDHNVSSELDHSAEGTSDLGSSLNNSSGGESPRKMTVPVQLPSYKRPTSRKYTEWEEDENTLLAGWKKRSYQHGIVNKKTMWQFLSPTQEMFETRSQMTEHLKSAGYSEQEINKVANGGRRGAGQSRSSFNDWVTDESLPNGWKKRHIEWNNNGRKAKKYTYMSTTSRIFNSRTEIVSFMRESSEFSESDIEKVLSGRESTKRVSNAGANPVESDFIPDQNEIGKRRLKVSNEIERPSKQPKMSNLKDDDSDDEDKEPVARKLNQFTDWTLDESLPDGWKVRSKEIEQNGNLVSLHQYLSPDRKVLLSRAEVDEYLKTLDCYKEDIETVLTEIKGKDEKMPEKLPVSNEHLLKSFYQNNTKKIDKPINNEHDLKNFNLSKLPLKNSVNLKTFDLPKGIDIIPMKSSENVNVQNASENPKMAPSGKIPSSEGLANQADWEVDESLPNGWKKRSFVRKWMSKGETKSAVQHQYLCQHPTRQIFSSRAQVIEFMRRSNYSENEISKVNEGKKSPFTKKPNNNLAANKNITITKVNENIEIPQLNKNVTITKVVDNNEMPQINRNISVTKVHISPQKIKKNDSNNLIYSNWEADNEIMPEGWKKRSFINASNVKLYQYLAPNHQLFSSAEEVFKFMKKSEFYNLDDAVKFLSGMRKLEDSVKNNPDNSNKTEITKKNINNYIPFEQTKKNLDIPIHSKIPVRKISEAPKNISLETIKENFSGISVEKANVQKSKTSDPIITVDVDADEDEDVESTDVSNCENKPVDLERNFAESYLMGRNTAPDEDDGIEHIETVTKHEWVDDKTLPEGWKRRPLIGHSNQRKRGSMVVTKYQYLSPEEVIFNSRKEIMSYMDSYTSIPNQDQIHKLFLEYEQENYNDGNHLQLDGQSENMTDIAEDEEDNYKKEDEMIDGEKDEAANSMDVVGKEEMVQNDDKQEDGRNIAVMETVVQDGTMEIVVQDGTMEIVVKGRTINEEQQEAIFENEQNEILYENEPDEEAMDEDYSVEVGMDIKPEEVAINEQEKILPEGEENESNEDIDCLEPNTRATNGDNAYIDENGEDQGAIDEDEQDEDKDQQQTNDEHYEKDQEKSGQEINYSEQCLDKTEPSLNDEDQSMYYDANENQSMYYDASENQSMYDSNDPMDYEVEKEGNNDEPKVAEMEESESDLQQTNNIVNSKQGEFDMDAQIDKYTNKDDHYEEHLNDDNVSRQDDYENEVDYSEENEAESSEDVARNKEDLEMDGQNEATNMNDQYGDSINDNELHKDENFKEAIDNDIHDKVIDESGELYGDEQEEKDEYEHNDNALNKDDQYEVTHDASTNKGEQFEEVISEEYEEKTNLEPYDSDEINADNTETSIDNDVPPVNLDQMSNAENENENEIDHKESMKQIKATENVMIKMPEKDTVQNVAPIQVMAIPIGPKIILKRSNFEMLSMMFSTYPTPSKSVMEDICDDTEMTPKDVKWTFIKLRHKFDHRKGEEVSKEDVNEMINTARTTCEADDLLEL